jgi:hypothetical protein
VKKSHSVLKTCGCIVLVLLLLVFLAGAGFYWFIHRLHDSSPGVSINDRTEVYMTPTQVESIRNIGQWEFLTVNDEELVDTMRPGVFTDDHLVRIYYGTLRLGLDLMMIDDDCFSVSGDTVTLSLPDVGLLDDDFIDEARTKAFHETGTWSGSDRSDLYQRARIKMMERSLTPENLQTARLLAESQMQKLMGAMGFKHVIIEFIPHQ